MPVSGISSITSVNAYYVSNANGHATASSSNSELTEEEKETVAELKKRDAEVRAHERAHAAAGGEHVRGGSYDYQIGPDGGRYAVGGEVSIDTSEVPDDPEATIRKMEVVRQAALSPMKPSSQDRAAAAQASQKAMQARQELAKKQAEEAEGNPDAFAEGIWNLPKGYIAPSSARATPIMDLIA